MDYYHLKGFHDWSTYTRYRGYLLFATNPETPCIFYTFISGLKSCWFTLVQELHKISRLHLSAQQVKIISYMESSLLSPYLGKISLLFQHGWDGYSLEDCDYRIEVELNSRNEKSQLPTDLKEALKNHMNKYTSNWIWSYK